MGEAVQGEPRKHAVFEKPFKVTPEYETWDTPDNYFRYPYSSHLPEKLKVWRVQNTGEKVNGVVAIPGGFEDSPDAEILAPGYNLGKENGSVGVGRHGNFLQWGFSAPPSQMTEAGKRFFLNCICYIQQFDRHGPLVKFTMFDRSATIRYALLLETIKNKETYNLMFTQEQIEKYSNKSKVLARHYRDNLELVYWDKTFIIDEDLRKLGIESNRTVTSLERIIKLFDNPGKAYTARLLLTRYTVESFESPAEWKSWFEKNRSRLYFSDVGGYKFRVVPEGYPLASK